MEEYKIEQLILNQEDDSNDFITTIRISGKIGDGSSGNENYKKIKRDCEKIIENEFTRSFILDLSQLEYTFGDWMEMIIDGFMSKKDYAIVVGEKCRRGISTLIKWDLNTKYDCVKEGENFFLNEKKAIDYLRVKSG